MPISNIVNGGHWATPQYEEIYSILKEYPQAVVFTGHSHYCMSDERAIMQKDLPLSIREQQAISILTGLIMKMKMKQTTFRRIFHKKSCLSKSGTT